MKELFINTGVPHWLQPPKLGRGEYYPEKVWHDILDRVASGHTLTSICKDPVMPDHGQLRRWIFAEESRKSAYYAAREVGAEKVEDEMLDIADGINNEMEDVQRSVLRVGTRKWLLGVWNRKRYGDTKQVDINHKVDLTAVLEQARIRVDNRPVIEGEVLNESV